jgi:hypothetical protein
MPLADPQFKLIKTIDQLFVLVVNFLNSTEGKGVGHTTLTRFFEENRRRQILQLSI